MRRFTAIAPKVEYCTKSEILHQLLQQNGEGLIPVFCDCFLDGGKNKSGCANKIFVADKETLGVYIPPCPSSLRCA